MDMMDCTYGTHRDTVCSDRRCRDVSSLPCRTPVAMAYVPFQQWDEVYCAEKALCVGTMFPCLNLPFVGCVK